MRVATALAAPDVFGRAGVRVTDDEVVRVATALAAPDVFGLLAPSICFGLPLEPALLALRRRVPAAPVLIRRTGAGPRRPRAHSAEPACVNCGWLPAVYRIGNRPRRRAL